MTTGSTVDEPELRDHSMIRLRGSIAGLLSTIAVLAVGFAALKVSSRLWASTFFSLALLCLVGSIAVLIYRKGQARAGFALFGWTYLFLAFGPSPQNGGPRLKLDTTLRIAGKPRKTTSKRTITM